MHDLQGDVLDALVVLVVYGGLVALTGWQFSRAPTGFIPQQDQGYLITVIQLPPETVEAVAPLSESAPWPALRNPPAGKTTR